MSFQPYDRNPSGIVFFGTNNSDSVYESNANFTIDGTSLRATNIKISDGGNIVRLAGVPHIGFAPPASGPDRSTIFLGSRSELRKSILFQHKEH